MPPQHEYWNARLLVRHDAPIEVGICGYVTTPAELQRFIDTLRKLATYLPQDEDERTLPIMPSQRGGLVRAEQKQTERAGA